VWRQPKARLIHPLPSNGPVQFYWRWLLYGHDQLLTEQETWARLIRPRWAAMAIGAIAGLLKILSLASWKPLKRLPAVLAADPDRIPYLPGAVLSIICIVSVALTGFVAGLLLPGLVAEFGASKLEEHVESGSVTQIPSRNRLPVESQPERAPTTDSTT
jgi:hypothetical protein